MNDMELRLIQVLLSWNRSIGFEVAARLIDGFDFNDRRTRFQFTKYVLNALPHVMRDYNGPRTDENSIDLNLFLDHLESHDLIKNQGNTIDDFAMVLVLYYTHLHEVDEAEVEARIADFENLNSLDLFLIGGRVERRSEGKPLLIDALRRKGLYWLFE